MPIFSKIKIEGARLVGSFLTNIRKFREWGFAGVMTYLRNHRRDSRFRKTLLGNARRFPMSPTMGVTIVADISANTSFGKVMRDFCFALQRANIPYQTFDLSTNRRVKDSDVDPLLTPKEQFRTLKYFDVVEMLDSPFPKGLPVRVSTVAFWEFESAFIDFYPFMFGKSCVVGMSDFNVRYFRRALPPSIDVRKILYPFRIPSEVMPKDDARRKFGLSPNDFIVFFNFDYASSCGRKNPDGSIRAFARAFSDVSCAKLVFKTMRASIHPEAVRALADLADELGVRDRIVSVDAYLSDDDLMALTNTCDVYLSLHRGEGFGLGIAEAMSLGKPVVVTDWSASTEFCKDGCAERVPFEIVPVPDEKKDHIAFRTLKEWADPNVNCAAKCLRKLYEDITYRSEMGHTAAQSIREQFSLERFRFSMENFLSRV